MAVTEPLAPKDEEELRHEQLADLRQLVMDRATTPSELALLLVALELSELRQVVQELNRSRPRTTARSSHAS